MHHTNNEIHTKHAPFRISILKSSRITPQLTMIDLEFERSHQTSDERRGRISIRIKIVNMRLLDILDINGETPLIVACRSKNYTAVENLADLGANVNATDSDGNTPLTFTLSISMYANLETWSMTKTLLEKNAP